MEKPRCNHRFGFLSSLILLTALISHSLAFSVPAQETIAELKQRESQIRDAVKRVMPATVCITDGIGFGSGVVVSEDGYVLTAGHVLLTEGEKLSIIFPDGREVAGKRLGKNLDVDAGMVKITEEGKWPFVQLGDSASLKRGDWTICLGHSGGYVLGRRPPVRTGRVLHTNSKRLVTDCALIGGDSGGPIFDINGKLIGINSSIASSIAENRHVAVNIFKQDWEQLAAGKTWGKLAELSKTNPNAPVLGVRLNKQLANRAEVLSVMEGSPAELAGIKQGDFITAIDREPISDWQHVVDSIADRRVGDRVKIEVERGEQVLELTAKLRRRDEK